MHIIVFGLNHNTAPLEIRERFYVSEERLNDFLKQLTTRGIGKSVVLSTCNRTEIYLATEDIDITYKILKDILSSSFQIEMEWFDRYTYLLCDEDAYRHLFQVASGLDSMVIGEPQILGQVKDAYRAASFMGTTGFYLNRLFHRTFYVAKKVRTETRIGYNPVSISSMAVELSRHIFGDLKNRKILVIGAGEMCEIALKNFKKEGLKDIYITNRTFQKAKALSEEIAGTPYPFQEIPGLLTKVDMILSSTGADNYIVKRDDMPSIMKKRKNRPIFIIDIAVPRDIDPAINEIENVYLYNIDDLKELSQRYMEGRLKESEHAAMIVEEEIAKFSQWLKQLEVHPIITHIIEQAEGIRNKELHKMLNRIKNIDEDTAKGIDLLTRTIVNKLIHPHIKLIKQQTNPMVLDIMKNLFNYEDEDEEKMDYRDEG
ncbi:MAG TPA: glutamyl-tRNA reductase [Syntrophorhabdaceae bacterium]|nr:glutamyl-tRNA reductase [Syntrophorhabdaceae bacterium]